jgi:hypothetical protein
MNTHPDINVLDGFDRWFFGGTPGPHDEPCSADWPLQTETRCPQCATPLFQSTNHEHFDRSFDHCQINRLRIVRI